MDFFKLWLHNKLNLNKIEYINFTINEWNILYLNKYVKYIEYLI